MHTKMFQCIRFNSRYKQVHKSSLKFIIESRTICMYKIRILDIFCFLETLFEITSPRYLSSSFYFIKSSPLNVSSILFIPVSIFFPILTLGQGIFKAKKKQRTIQKLKNRGWCSIHGTKIQNLTTTHFSKTSFS